MGARIYTGTGPAMSTDSATDIDSIQQWFQAHQANQQAKQASSRADSQLAMQQAEHNYNMKNMQDMKNSADALQTYAGQGYDWSSLASMSNTGVFAKDLPDAGLNFKGYQVAMQSGGTTPDMAMFFEKKNQNDRAYMNIVVKKHNAIWEQVKQNNPGSSDDDVHRYMAENFSGDKVFQNATLVFDNAGVEGAGLRYSPVEKKRNWLQKIGDWAWQPSVKGPMGGPGVGGGLNWGAVVPALGITGGALKYRSQAKATSEDYLKEAKKHHKPAKFELHKKGPLKGKPKIDKKTGNKIRVGGGLTVDDFKKQYGISKTAWGGPKGKKYKASELALEKAKKIGRTGTWPYKAAESLKGKTGQKVLGAGKKYLPGAIGYSIGEALTPGDSALDIVGGGAGAAYGQAKGIKHGKAGLKHIVNKLKDPKALTTLKPILKRAGLGKMLTKLGISAAGYFGPQAAEPVTTVLGIAGTAWVAYDLIKLARDLPELAAWLKS